jgi:hypothetical protein
MESKSRPKSTGHTKKVLGIGAAITALTAMLAFPDKTEHYFGILSGGVQILTGGLDKHLTALIELKCYLQENEQRFRATFTADAFEKNPAAVVRTSEEMIQRLTEGIDVLKNLAESRLRISSAISGDASQALKRRKAQLTGDGAKKIHEYAACFRGKKGAKCWAARKFSDHSLQRNVISLSDNIKEMLGLLSRTEGILAEMTDSSLQEGFTDNEAINMIIRKRMRLVLCDVGPGNSGNDVKNIQEILTITGDYTGKITRHYDAPTRKAVSRFQASLIIDDPSGHVGRRTREELNRLRKAQNRD